MGFLENAKRKFQKVTRGIGEETIRVVDYDEEQEPPSKKQARPAKNKAVAPKRREPITSSQESAFDVDNESEDYFAKQEAAHQELLSSYGDRPIPKVQEGRIQDVLSLLDIPSTFELESSVMLPEDFESIDFSIQVPQGYEMGEVNAFVGRTKYTVTELVKLLKLRNKHIAELATTVDRLQVDANNLKFEAEIVNGINIMPTDENENFESENMELRLLVKRLEDQLRASKNSGSQMYNKEKQAYESLSDNFSILQRKYDSLGEENYDLKNRLAVIENNEPLRGMSDTEDVNITDVFTNEVITDSDFDTHNDDSLPDLSDDLEYFSSSKSIPAPSKNSAFLADSEESLDEFLETNKDFYKGHDYDADETSDFGSFSGQDSPVSYDYDNDSDDDELERIMNSGKGVQ